MAYLLSSLLQHIDVSYNGRDIEISGLHTLSEASSCELSFLSDAKYLKDLPYTKAYAVLIEEKYVDQVPSGTIAVVVKNPYLSMAQLSRFFAYTPSVEECRPKAGESVHIAQSVRFGTNVTIGDDVTIMAGCYVGDGVTIADRTILYPNVTIYHNCHIGKNCIIHAGVVIGADGFGFAQTDKGKHVKIYQNGNVVIADDVEIGALTTIDRATFGSTVVARGTKIDNLVQVAHNCQIGEDCLLVCQTALAGSTMLGDGVVMGGQSGATGHLQIGSHATIASRAGVTKSLKGDTVYAGFPATEHKQWLKAQACVQKLSKKQNN